MLTNSKKQEEKWPTLKQMAIPPVKLINVTGQKISSTSITSRNLSDSGDELNFEPVPTTSSLGDAIVQALQRAENSELLENSKNFFKHVLILY